MGTRLEGKVALVSGSTRGIGRSIAELFGAEGAKVAVTGRTVEKGEKVVARIRDAGGDAEFFRLDITDEDSVRDTVQAVVERFGSLSTLINNAAPTTDVSTTVKPLAELTTEEWTGILGPTLTGSVFWATKYSWPHLVSAKGAAIVNISSGQSVTGFSGFSAYAAAKGGVNSVTRTIAVEGAAHDIRCNCLVVGRVVSGRGDTGVGIGGDKGGRLTRVGNPTDIAYAATWLASAESEFVSGELITTDGGFGINGDATMRGG